MSPVPSFPRPAPSSPDRRSPDRVFLPFFAGGVDEIRAYENAEDDAVWPELGDEEREKAFNLINLSEDSGA